jgi:hypothetical protein
MRSLVGGLSLREGEARECAPMRRRSGTRFLHLDYYERCLAG